MNTNQLEMEISRIDREIEELYEERDEMLRQKERLMIQEILPVKIRNGHGQDYLDYEASTNPNEISER